MVGRTPSAHNAAIMTILDANSDRTYSLPPVSRRIIISSMCVRRLTCEGACAEDDNLRSSPPYDPLRSLLCAVGVLT